MNKALAECVGLWLAEGDNKSRYEITFTNNCYELIEHFHNNLNTLFKNKKHNKRVYIYSRDNEKVKINLEIDKIKRYCDKRANKPYFIWRLASVNLMKDWRKIVKDTTNKEDLYEDILRGFFAGEGNIKYDAKSCSRTVRIAQGKRNQLIEDIMIYLNIPFKYLPQERSYGIWGRHNWNKLEKIKIAELHPEKKEKFNRVFKGFKETHYSANYLKTKTAKLLKNKYYTTKELAKIFKRSPARLCEVLIDLKKEGKIKNYRSGSKSYWTKSNFIIISPLKKRYINLIKKGLKRTNEFSKILRVGYKASHKRLKELEKLELIKRNKDKTWELINSHKRTIVV
tara:strand:- start:217 stop:1236 length:1020 start_codon:yes stop_codon:yes gene_type:complete